LKEATARLRELLKACGAPTRLRDVGVLEEELEALVERVNPERLANDTLEPTAEDLRRVLRSSW
jgi:alcohol dehydrogenase class IV